MTTFRFEVRAAVEADMAFLSSLAPRLAGVPRPAWHDAAAMLAFQQRFMASTLGNIPEQALTLIAESPEGLPLGYVHAHPGKDGVTDEPCGYIALIALEEAAQGSGVAHELMSRAEDWAKEMGYRFLALDAFATNQRALDFYARRGFAMESVRMVKVL